MISWKFEDISPKKDGSIEKQLIKAGDGYSQPNEGAFVEGKCTHKK